MDNKKYYYLKLKDNFFESDAMILLESMPDGYLYSNILLKLYLRSLKDNGRLMLNGTIPYNPQMLANVTRHQIGTVEKALDIFKQFGFVEVLDSGAMYMMDIQNFIGKSSTEADRKRIYRSRIENEKNHEQIPEQTPGQMSGQMSGQISTRDRDRDRDRNRDRNTYQQIVDMYNNTCVSFPRLTKLSDKRKKAIRARLRSYSMEDFQQLFEMAEGSSFLKGQNSRNWSATFDWLIADSNMAKVLDGNYVDKKEGYGNVHGDSEQRGESGSREPASSIYNKYLE